MRPRDILGPALVIILLALATAAARAADGALTTPPANVPKLVTVVIDGSSVYDATRLFPTYRDTVAAVGRGVDPVEALTLLKGDWHCGYDPYEHHVAPHATPPAIVIRARIRMG